MKRLTILLFILTGCGEKIDEQPRPGDIHSLPAFEWRIESKEELERAYLAAGMPMGERDRLHGFVGKDSTGTWVIYTMPPKRVDDSVTCTLGHEVMHIALGDYHR